ncbi:MAG: hypothetical protein IJX78_05980 [Bacilli bacterium]|nr:hypothetical protein [Bacilli bacterium]
MNRKFLLRLFIAMIAVVSILGFTSTNVEVEAEYVIDGSVVHLKNGITTEKELLVSIFGFSNSSASTGSYGYSVNGGTPERITYSTLNNGAGNTLSFNENDVIQIYSFSGLGTSWSPTKCSIMSGKSVTIDVYEYILDVTISIGGQNALLETLYVDSNTVKEYTADNYDSLSINGTTITYTPSSNLLSNHKLVVENNTVAVEAVNGVYSISNTLKSNVELNITYTQESTIKPALNNVTAEIKIGDSGSFSALTSTTSLPLGTKIYIRLTPSTDYYVDPSTNISLPGATYNKDGGWSSEGVWTGSYTITSTATDYILTVNATKHEFKFDTTQISLFSPTSSEYPIANRIMDALNEGKDEKLDYRKIEIYWEYYLGNQWIDLSGNESKFLLNTVVGEDKIQTYENVKVYLSGKYGKCVIPETKLTEKRSKPTISASPDKIEKEFEESQDFKLQDIINMFNANIDNGKSFSSVTINGSEYTNLSGAAISDFGDYTIKFNYAENIDYLAAESKTVTLVIRQDTDSTLNWTVSNATVTATVNEEVKETSGATLPAGQDVTITITPSSQYYLEASKILLDGVAINGSWNGATWTGTFTTASTKTTYNLSVEATPIANAGFGFASTKISYYNITSITGDKLKQKIYDVLKDSTKDVFNINNVTIQFEENHAGQDKWVVITDGSSFDRFGTDWSKNQTYSESVRVYLSGVYSNCYVSATLTDSRTTPNITATTFNETITDYKGVVTFKEYLISKLDVKVAESDVTITGVTDGKIPYGTKNYVIKVTVAENETYKAMAETEVTLNVTDAREELSFTNYKFNLYDIVSDYSKIDTLDEIKTMLLNDKMHVTTFSILSITNSNNECLYNTDSENPVSYKPITTTGIYNIAFVVLDTETYKATAGTIQFEVVDAREVYVFNVKDTTCAFISLTELAGYGKLETLLTTIGATGLLSAIQNTKYGLLAETIGGLSLIIEKYNSTSGQYEALETISNASLKTTEVTKITSAGQYKITIDYDGNSKYRSGESTVIFTLNDGRTETGFYVPTNEITKEFSSKLERTSAYDTLAELVDLLVANGVQFKLNGAASVITVNGNTITEETETGIGAVGTYTIALSCKGDETHKPATPVTITLKISDVRPRPAINSSIEVEVSDFADLTFRKLIIDKLTIANGVTILDSDITVSVTNYNATDKIPYGDATYTVKVKVNENDKYFGLPEQTVTLKIKDTRSVYTVTYDSEIDITDISTIDTLLAKDNILNTLEVNLANATVDTYADPENVEFETTYSVTIKIEGSDTYKPLTQTLGFKLVDARLSSSLSMNGTGSYNTPSTSSSTINDLFDTPKEVLDIIGNVELTVNGQLVTSIDYANIKFGEIKFKVNKSDDWQTKNAIDAVGIYQITFVYETNTIKQSFAIATFTIVDNRPVVTLDTYTEKVYAKLNDATLAAIKEIIPAVYADGNVVNTNLVAISSIVDAEGNEYYNDSTLNLVNDGTYTVTISIQGSETNQASALTFTFKIERAATSIAFPTRVTIDVPTLSGLETGLDTSEEIVNAINDEVEYKFTAGPLTATVKNGVTINKAGEYTVVLSFAGDNDSAPCSQEITLVVNDAREEIEITYTNTEYEATDISADAIKAALANEADLLAQLGVSVKVNGNADNTRLAKVEIKITDNAGNIVNTIDALGVYTITLTYPTDDTNKPVNQCVVNFEVTDNRAATTINANSITETFADLNLIDDKFSSLDAIITLLEANVNGKFKPTISYIYFDDNADTRATVLYYQAGKEFIPFTKVGTYKVVLSYAATDTHLAAENKEVTINVIDGREVIVLQNTVNEYPVSNISKDAISSKFTTIDDLFKIIGLKVLVNGNEANRLGKLTYTVSDGDKNYYNETGNVIEKVGNYSIKVTYPESNTNHKAELVVSFDIKDKRSVVTIDANNVSNPGIGFADLSQIPGQFDTLEEILKTINLSVKFDGTAQNYMTLVNNGNVKVTITDAGKNELTALTKVGVYTVTIEYIDDDTHDYKSEPKSVTLTLEDKRINPVIDENISKEVSDFNTTDTALEVLELIKNYIKDEKGNILDLSKQTYTIKVNGGNNGITSAGEYTVTVFVEDSDTCNAKTLETTLTIIDVRPTAVISVPNTSVGVDNLNEDLYSINSLDKVLEELGAYVSVGGVKDLSIKPRISAIYVGTINSIDDVDDLGVYYADSDAYYPIGSYKIDIPGKGFVKFDQISTYTIRLHLEDTKSYKVTVKEVTVNLKLTDQRQASTMTVAPIEPVDIYNTNWASIGRTFDKAAILNLFKAGIVVNGNAMVAGTVSVSDIDGELIDAITDYGSHTITFKFAGDNTHKPCTQTATLTLVDARPEPTIPSELSINVPDYGKDIIAQIKTLVLNNLTANANGQEVTIDANKVTVTIGNGITSIPVGYDGTYELKVTVAESETYKATTAKVTLTVNDTRSETSIEAKDYSFAEPDYSAIAGKYDEDSEIRNVLNATIVTTGTALDASNIVVTRYETINSIGTYYIELKFNGDMTHKPSVEVYKKIELTNGRKTTTMTVENVPFDASTSATIAENFKTLESVLAKFNVVVNDGTETIVSPNVVITRIEELDRDGNVKEVIYSGGDYNTFISNIATYKVTFKYVEDDTHNECTSHATITITDGRTPCTIDVANTVTLNVTDFGTIDTLAEIINQLNVKVLIGESVVENPTIVVQSIVDAENNSYINGTDCTINAAGTYTIAFAVEATSSYGTSNATVKVVVNDNRIATEITYTPKGLATDNFNKVFNIISELNIAVKDVAGATVEITEILLNDSSVEQVRLAGTYDIYVKYNATDLYKECTKRIRFTIDDTRTEISIDDIELTVDDFSIVDSISKVKAIIKSNIELNGGAITSISEINDSHFSISGITKINKGNGVYNITYRLTESETYKGITNTIQLTINDNRIDTRINVSNTPIVVNEPNINSSAINIKYNSSEKLVTAVNAYIENVINNQITKADGLVIKATADKTVNAVGNYVITLSFEGDNTHKPAQTVTAILSLQDGRSTTKLSIPDVELEYSNHTTLANDFKLKDNVLKKFSISLIIGDQTISSPNVKIKSIVDENEVSYYEEYDITEIISGGAYKDPIVKPGLYTVTFEYEATDTTLGCTGTAVIEIKDTRPTTSIDWIDPNVDSNNFLELEAKYNTLDKVLEALECVIKNQNNISVDGNVVINVIYQGELSLTGTILSRDNIYYSNGKHTISTTLGNVSVPVKDYVPLNKAGTYTIELEFIETATHQGSKATATFTVTDTRAESTVTFTDPMISFDNRLNIATRFDTLDKVLAALTPNVNGVNGVSGLSIVSVFNGTKAYYNPNGYDLPIIGSNKVIDFNGLDQFGEYTVTVSFAGDNTYQPGEYTAKLTVVDGRVDATLVWEYDTYVESKLTDSETLFSSLDILTQYINPMVKIGNGEYYSSELTITSIRKGLDLSDILGSLGEDLNLSDLTEEGLKKLGFYYIQQGVEIGGYNIPINVSYKELDEATDYTITFVYAGTDTVKGFETEMTFTVSDGRPSGEIYVPNLSYDAYNFGQIPVKFDSLESLLAYLNPTVQVETFEGINVSYQGTFEIDLIVRIDLADPEIYYSKGLTLLGKEYGAQAYEPLDNVGKYTIHISCPGAAEYQKCDTTITFEIKDMRGESETECEEVTIYEDDLSTIGSDFETLEKVLKAFNPVAYDAKGNRIDDAEFYISAIYKGSILDFANLGNNIYYMESILGKTIDYKGIDSVGEYNVIIKFKGNNSSQPSDVTVKLTIVDARPETQVNLKSDVVTQVLPTDYVTKEEVFNLVFESVSIKGNTASIVDYGYVSANVTLNSLSSATNTEITQITEAGVYTITVKFPATSTHLGSEATVEFMVSDGRNVTKVTNNDVLEIPFVKGDVLSLDQIVEDLGIGLYDETNGVVLNKEFTYALYRGTTEIQASSITTFGQTYTILVNYAGDDEYAPCSKRVEFTVVDGRTKTYIDAATSISVVYNNYTAEDVYNLLLDGYLGAYIINENGIKVAIDKAEIRFSLSDAQIETLNAGDHTITLSYAGSEYDYQPATLTCTITVEKAPAKVNVVSGSFNYKDIKGTGVNISERITTEPELEVIELAIGLNASAGMMSYLNIPNLIDLDSVPESVRPYVQTILDNLGFNEQMSISELKAAIEGIKDALEMLENLVGVSLSSDALDSTIKLLEQLEKISSTTGIEIMLTMGKDIYLEEAGLYLIGAVTTSQNYETAFGLGYITIIPDATKVELGFNVEVENFMVTKASIMQDPTILGAHVKKDGLSQELYEAATSKLATLYIGIDINGEQYVTDQPISELGAYTQIAYTRDLGNEMLYAIPIVRVYTVVIDTISVEFVNDDAEFKYNGMPQGLIPEAYADNGDILPNEYLTCYYNGVMSNGEVYSSTELPTNVGFYTVTAIYNNPELLQYGLAVGTMTIYAEEHGMSLEDVELFHDGEPHNVVINNPYGLEEIILVLGNDTHTVNVILPESWGVKDEFFDIQGQLSPLVKLIHILQLFADNELIDKVEEILSDLPLNSIAVNGDSPVEAGRYEYIVIGYKQNYDLFTGEAVLNLKHNLVAKQTDNYHWQECTICDYYTDFSGHTYGDWQVEQAHTCITDGIETRYCSGCDHFETRTTEATGHLFVEWNKVKNPKCYEVGIEVSTCERCGEAGQRDIATIPHTYTHWEDTVEATTDEPGKAESHCDVCGHVGVKRTPTKTIFEVFEDFFDKLFDFFNSFFNKLNNIINALAGNPDDEETKEQATDDLYDLYFGEEEESKE